MKNFKNFILVIGLILLYNSAVLAAIELPNSRFAPQLQVSISGSPITSGDLHNFGTVNLFSSSAPLTITLENIGAPEDLNISQVSVVGTDASDYSLNTSGMLSVVPSSGSTTFTITFSPGASGARIGAIEIQSDDPNGTFIINLSGTGVKLDQSISFDPLAARTYGESSFTLSATATSGLAVSYLSSDPLVATISGNTVTIVGAGSTVITATQGGDATYNPAASLPQSLTVNKASITATSNNQTRVYSAANPAFTISYSGFVNGDDAADFDITPTATTTAASNSPVGDYPINAAGGIDNNYSFTYVAGTLTITKATPVITWNTPAAITYGTALSATQLNASSNVAGTFTYAPLSGTILDAGNQTLSVDFVPADATNYNSVIGTTTTITVNKATVTATAENKSKLYGASMPALTIVYSGFVNSETQAVLDALPSITTVATSASDVGIYDITLSGGSDLNYTINLVNGSLTINKVTLTATANNQTRTYLAADPAFTISYSGFVNGDDAGDIDTPPTATSTALVNSTVGNYPINAAGGVDNNYSFTYVAGILTITKATPVITWNNPAAITYGTGLSATQLNASSSVAGTFIYNPALDAILNAGPDQSLSVNFVPADGINYNTVIGVTATITVNKATITATAENKNKLYGAAIPALTIAYSGFVNSETQSVLDALPTISTLATAGSDVGAYDITLSGGADANYNIVLVNGTLTINKAPLTATVNNQTRVYGAVDPAFTISYTGFVNGDDAADIDLPPTASTTALVNSPVGNYPITATGGVDNNYSFTYVAGTLTITKATPMVTWSNPAAITYGTALSATQLNASSSVAGTFTYSPASGTILNAGINHVLSVDFVPSDNTNYNSVIGTTVTITVNKATVTATAENKSRVFGAANPAFTITYSGFVNSETQSVLDVLPSASSVATSTSNAGVYAITLAGGSDLNYNITLVNGTLTVNKAPLTATAENKARAYGAADPAFTILYAGFVNGNTVADLDSPPVASTLATSTSVPGSYSITLSGGSDLNYELTLVNGTLTISKATLTVTANNQSRLYGQANPTFTLAYAGFVNGETTANLTTVPTATTIATVTSSVGAYSITVSGGVSDNYNFIYVSGTLTISKASITATAANQSRSYGAANPTLTINYTGFANGETSAVLDVTPTASTTAGATTAVGSYAIDVVGGSDNNYDIIRVSGTLTITKAALVATAANASRTYGAANPTFVINYSGFQNGETAAVLDVAPTATTVASLASDVGTYPITVAGGSDGNYSFTYVDGTLTISKASLTATVANASRIYGVANPSFTISYAGFVNGETSSVIDVLPVASTVATISSNVGTYAITASGGSDLNYSFTYVNGTLTITKATPVITWNNPAAIIYGTPLGASQLNATASVAGTLTYVPASGTVLNTGANQVLTVNFSPTDGVNYNVVSGTTVLITVNKATLTATANNQARLYGALNPTLTISYSGFINGDNVSAIDIQPTASTTANNISGTGTYPITPSGGSDNNYEFVFVDGTLTINKATLNVTAQNFSRLYGAGNPSFTMVYSGFVNSENESVIDVLPTLTTAATPASAVGIYPITVSGGSDNNYTFTYTQGQLTITKATVTATVSNATRIYGATNPTFTITYSGFVNSETSSVLDVLPTATTAATAASNVGTYSINASGGSDNNYLFTYVSGVLTITKATPTVTWNNPVAITYGTALSGTQLNATASVPGTFVYNPVAGTILNAGVNQTLSVNFSPTDATNYEPVNGTTVQITVNKANPVITWPSPSAITYGTALSATQLNASANVAGTFVYSPASGVVLNAGANQSLSVNFTPTDGSNYNSITGFTTLITVNKATPTVIWNNPSAITYGTPLSATQLNATASVAGSFVYAPGLGTILNAGANQTLSVNFTPTNTTNYNSVNGTTVLITVNKATPTVTWSNPANITYGTALGASQLNATASVGGSFVYTPAAGTILNAGNNQLLSVNFTPTDNNNYNAVSGTTVQINVGKATPTITWNNPAAITYGTALSATQLNASTPVAGTFVYTPTLGTQLDAGSNQVLSVSFTPTDAANYNSVNNLQRLITVNKATPTITWTNPSAIVYGTPLTSTQLNATANVPGSFVYTPAAGTILNAGSNQTLSVNFTPTDAANYNAVNGTTVSVSVSKATPLISWPTPLPIKVNEPLTALQLNATANVPGSFSYSPVLGSSYGSVGTYTLTTSFTPSDAANYNPVPSTQVQIQVNNKDNPVVSWNSPSAITYGTTLSATQLNATANVPGTFVYTPALGTLLSAGSNHTLSVNFVPTDGINYNSISSNVTISVNQATLTATATNASRVYGAANPTFTITYSGFVNSENSSVIDTAPTATCSAIASSNAGGSFPIIPSGGVDNNYSFTYVNGSLTINKAPLTASADNKSRSYGLANPTFTISYTGFVNGDTESEITPPTISTSASITSNVGTYPIQLAGGTSTNYNFTLQNGSLTIVTSPLIARAVDLTKTYGQTNPTLAISYTGFLNGDDVSSITAPSISTTAGTTSAVGTYPITLSGGSASNYGIILQAGTLVVTKATLTITANNQNRLYGTANPTFTFSYSGFMNSETASVLDVLPTASVTATAASNVGIYPITLSGGSDNNYQFVFVSGNLTINKAILTASVANASRIYGASNPTFTINYTGFVNGDNISSLDTEPTASTVANATSNVGTYTITASGGADINYLFTYVSGTLTISKATLTAIAANTSRPYLTANPAFIINYTGFANSETSAVLDVLPTASTTALVASPVGTYPITVTGGSANNYSFTYQSGTLSVIKANPVITWNNPSAITYGTALGGSQLNASSNVPGSFTYTPVAGTVLNAGANQTLTANFTPTDGTNYNAIGGLTVVITVNKATPTVTWSNPANITYGTPLSGTQLNATSSVLGTFTYSPASGTVLNAGANQTLSVNFTPNDAVNYNVVNNRTVQISVGKATPVVAWNNPAAITYGTPLDATQLNATASVAGTFIYSPLAGTVLNAGVNQSLSVSFAPTDAANYNSVPSTSVQITVNKAIPVITWSAPSAITYGTALGSTQLNASANTPGTFTYTPPAGTILNAGSNQVLSVNFAPTSSANFNSVTGFTVLISVNKATPVITWNSPSSIVYGTALGATQLNATASVAGTFTYTPIAGTVLHAGDHTLSVDFTPTNTTNYLAVTETEVDIEITKKELMVVANDQTRSYGSANPELTLTFTGFVSGENETVLNTKPEATTEADIESNTGTYSIDPANGSDDNYSFSYTAGSLTITKASLTVTAEDKSKFFGMPNPALTIAYTGFVNNEDASVLDVVPTVSTVANQASPAGGYPIVVGTGSDNNYDFNYVQGTFTIVPNFPPTLTNFTLSTNEDQSLGLNLDVFEDHFVSFSESPINYVRIVTLPVNGVLTWKGNPVTIGTEVAVTNGEIENLVFVPTTNFAGGDSFKWNAFDGAFLALQDATLSITILKVNDAPVLSNIETTSILYSPGDDPIKITNDLVINDLDDNFVFSAKVVISENFTRGDVLEAEAGISTQIVTAYNSQNGELTLIGKDTKANYQAALAKIMFSSPVSGDASVSDKRVTFTVKDSVDVSNAMSRIVSITEIFPEVDIVNAFTPNGDGVNDVWDFVNLDYYSEVAISIYDRNGSSVFTCNTNDCTWDGKVNGKVLPAGTYFYTLYLNGGKRKYSGTVTILR